MSFQDRLTAQDTLQLLSTGASLALVTAGSASGGGYNLPIMLFGIVGHELKSSNVVFRQFLLIISVSFFLDLFFLFFRSHSTLIWVISLLIALIKVPIWFSGLGVLRERGGELGVGVPNLQSFGGGGASNANWNLPMPGGFSDHSSANNAHTHTGVTSPGAQQPPASFPTTGGSRLGGDGEGHTPSGQPGKNGYQTIG